MLGLGYMNGEYTPHTKTETAEKALNTEEEKEWKALSGQLSGELPLPGAPRLPSEQELAPEQLPTGENQPEEIFESNITARLNPEPLAEEKKQELLVKSLSDSAKDVAGYGKERAAMTPEQRKQFDEHRENAILYDMQATNPDSFNREIAALPPEKQSAYYAYEQATGQAAQATAQAEHNAIVEQATKLENDKDFLILHSLKFSDPSRFEKEFEKLDPKKKEAFDAFEVREDAKMKLNNPNMMIPKLSTDGEKWKVSGELSEEAVASLPPKQPYRTAEQMREAGPAAYKEQQDFVNTIKAEEKPKGWKRVASWFSRKSKPGQEK